MSSENSNTSRRVSRAGRSRGDQVRSTPYFHHAPHGSARVACGRNETVRTPWVATGKRKRCGSSSISKGAAGIECSRDAWAFSPARLRTPPPFLQVWGENGRKFA
eukprot:scaffold33002_cov87-Phaeocystis_antarctica.AAC.1